MFQVKEIEADDVVHEVTISIIGLSGIVGGGPIEVSDVSATSSPLLSHSLTGMKAVITVLYKNRAQHFGAPLSEHLQYSPTTPENFVCQRDDDMLIGTPTFIDPRSHYTASWERHEDAIMTAESSSTVSFDCVLRVTADGKAKPRRFELVTALVDCNNNNASKTLTAVPMGVCELVIGRGGKSHCKQILELPVRSVSTKHGYPTLHIFNPDFNHSSALAKHKQLARERRRALLRSIAKRGLCFRWDGAITGEDNHDDLLSRDCTRADGGDSSLTGSCGYSIASQQQVQAAAHLEKAVLRVEVEWKVKEFFEVYLEDPLLDCAPRTAPGRSLQRLRSPKLNSPDERQSTTRLLARSNRDPSQWDEDDPFRSAPLAAGAIITAALSEVFSCVASETNTYLQDPDFHARLLADSRALEDIIFCAVPLHSIASPSKRREPKRALKRKPLLCNGKDAGNCIEHEESVPALPVLRQVSDNSTCHGDIHSSSDTDDSSCDFLDHLMRQEHENQIPQDGIHGLELAQTYPFTNDASFGSAQSSCLLNPIPIMPTHQPTEPMDSPTDEVTVNQIWKKQVAECDLPGNGLDSSSISGSRPKAQNDLAKVSNPEVGKHHVVPYLPLPYVSGIEGDSFPLIDKLERNPPATLSEIRQPSPSPNHREAHNAATSIIKRGPSLSIKPKPHQKPIEWIQFDKSADLQSILTDNEDYFKSTTGAPDMLEAGAFPWKKVLTRKNTGSCNRFRSLAIIEERSEIETRQSPNKERYAKASSPLGLQISIPQNHEPHVDNDSAKAAGRKNYFADLEEALDDTFWSGPESMIQWNGIGMQLATSEYAKDTSSLPFEPDQDSI